MKARDFFKNVVGEFGRIAEPEDEDYEDDDVEYLEEEASSERRERSERDRSDRSKTIDRKSKTDRAPRESRETREPRELRESREPRESRESRETRERSSRRTSSSKELATPEWERPSRRVPSNEPKSRLRSHVKYEEEEAGGSSSIVKFPASSMQQVVVMKPKDLSEVRNIANYLCSKYTILLNMENTVETDVQRIIDFIAGVAYANDGRVSMLNDTFYLVTPFTVNLTAEIIGGLENEGIFYQT